MRLKTEYRRRRLIDRRCLIRPPVLRAGYSLVELMVVMSLASTVLTLTATWIAKSQDLHRHRAKHGESIDQRWRWSQRWVEDVHRSDDATIENNVLHLSRDGESIRYEMLNDAIVRKDDVSQQRFTLDRMGRGRWRLLDRKILRAEWSDTARPWRHDASLDRWSSLGWTAAARDPS